MYKRSIFLSVATAVVVSGAMGLAACGGTGTAMNTVGGNGGASPVMLSAGDAPMSSVVAALVTVSAVDLTDSSGNSTQILKAPRTIELTHLGGVREPLELDQLAAGTYSSVSVTVSAAKITYLDPTTGQPVTADASIPSASATASLTLNPPLTISGQTAADLHFDFDLQKSLDLTGGTVTFTPVISAGIAKVESEGEDARRLHVSGTVTAIDTTKNTLTLTTTDTQMSVTLNVTSNTDFSDGMALNTMQTGTTVNAVAKLNADGSLTALEIESSNGGESVDSNSQVDAGLVTSVSLDSNQNLTSFTMVVRGGDDMTEWGQPLTVQIGSGTTFKDTSMAIAAGLATFDDTQIFPGAGVQVAGTNSATAGTVVATEIRPAAVNPFGLVNAAVQTVSGGLTIPLLVDNHMGIAQAGGITNVNVATNSATVFDGENLTSTTAANLAVGTPLVARGYLSFDGTTYTLFAEHVKEEVTGSF